MVHNPIRKAGLPTIVDVDSLDGDYFSIHLSNEHRVLFGLGSRIRDPAFAALIEHKEFDKPQTDGMRLYWPNGPSLHIDEIMEMVVS